MLKLIIRILMIAGLTGYLVSVFFLFNNKWNEEVCADVEICIIDSIENPFLKKKDVRNLLQKHNIRLKGKPMDEINTYKVGQTLLENQLIREAVCYKTQGGNIRIDIYQRNPILRVIGINGNYYVDDKGYIMPVSYNFTAHLPVATGYVSKEFAKNELFNFGLFLNKNGGKNQFWKSQIEQIHVLPDGDVEIIPKVGDHVILLGKLDDFEKKLDKMMTFYQEGLNKKGWNHYKKISLKYENQVICSK